MTVTFCGHSKLYHQSESFSKWLDLILPSLIEGGADTFYLGGYGDFDSLAAGGRHAARHICFKNPAEGFIWKTCCGISCLLFRYSNIFTIPSEVSQAPEIRRGRSYRHLLRR